MLIKFKDTHFKLNGKYWTDSASREFMQDKTNQLYEATKPNMNYYKLVVNGMLIHVYDAYEVKEI